MMVFSRTNIESRIEHTDVLRVAFANRRTARFWNPAAKWEDVYRAERYGSDFSLRATPEQCAGWQLQQSNDGISLAFQVIA